MNLRKIFTLVYASALTVLGFRQREVKRKTAHTAREPTQEELRYDLYDLMDLALDSNFINKKGRYELEFDSHIDRRQLSKEH